tara:strand:+ start:2729 stop:3490 length:762 start_codon:yes stop_codon:yes gene_type:complete
MRNSLILILIFTVAVGKTQMKMYQRKNIPLIDFNGTYQLQNFYLSPGLTYMMPYEIPNIISNSNSEVNAKARLAYIIEAGAYRIFEKGGNIFNYLDYGFSYKKLSGSETIDESKSIFKQRFLGGSFNLNNIWQISDKKFIQTSLGSNIDFKLFEEGTPLPNNTDRLTIAFHLKVGYGFKVKKTLFVIPTMESPFLTLKKWEQGKSTYGIFNSRYRPLIFKVRFIWLKKLGKGKCPEALTSPEDKARYERNYMQ